jgi:hypothetical protein
MVCDDMAAEISRREQRMTAYDLMCADDLNEPGYTWNLAHVAMYLDATVRLLTCFTLLVYACVRLACTLCGIVTTNIVHAPVPLCSVSILAG